MSHGVSGNIATQYILVAAHHTINQTKQNHALVERVARHAMGIQSSLDQKQKDLQHALKKLGYMRGQLATYETLLQKFCRTQVVQEGMITHQSSQILSLNKTIASYKTQEADLCD